MFCKLQLIDGLCAQVFRDGVGTQQLKTPTHLPIPPTTGCCTHVLLYPCCVDPGGLNAGAAFSPRGGAYARGGALLAQLVLPKNVGQPALKKGVLSYLYVFVAAVAVYGWFGC